MKEIVTADFESEVLQADKVVVDFYSSECPPCEALAPKFESLAAIYGNDITFVKVFRQQNRDLAERLGVSGSPTLIFFNKGKETGIRLSGGIKRSEIMVNLNAMLHEDRVNDLKSKLKPMTSVYDVAIIGSGPGGLTAGLYLCQARINTVLIDTGLPGGHVSLTHQVSNYPGFIDPQPGYLLSHNMSEQTKRCGSVFKVAVDVSRIDLQKKEIVIDEYETIQARKIIIATGTSPNYLNVPGEKELKGQGISYCATCDAKYYGDKEVVVIGGGNSAVEEAEFITKFASKVTMVHQFDKFQANRQAQEKLLANPRVHVLFRHEPRSFSRRGHKMVVEVEDLSTGTRKELLTDGVFIFVGLKPNIDLFGGKLELDQWGYLKTDEDMRTSIHDIYAVGDVRSKKYRQITTAIADGTIAAINITRELDN
ncbi:MAG TPA: FAD-dependent oxidoreductase [Bacteroidales bacterium]|nr:FAD-dependent oxidoreductase [Bacteroidales bacterium]